MYAQNTSVSEVQSRIEIERLIRKHCGRDAAFSFGSMAGKAAIVFTAHGRQIKFEIPLPTREEAIAKAGRKYRGEIIRNATDSQAKAWLDQEDRRRWRCMLLIIKAKFEAVEMKLELAESEEERASIFEQEFLACIVSPSGQTVYEAIQGASVGHKLLPPVSESKIVDIEQARR